jgi:hypothetical protein
MFAMQQLIDCVDETPIPDFYNLAFL